MTQAKEASYVGAYYDRDHSQVLVWERSEEGRQLKRYPAEFCFFVPDAAGEYKGLFNNEPLKKLEFESEDEMAAARRQYSRIYESDIPPLFKTLMNRYAEKPVPVVNFAFFDIEVNYTSKMGFAGPSNPYAIINAITVYQSWTKKYFTLVVPPVVNGVKWKGTVEDLYARHRELVESGKLQEGQETEFIICGTESLLLQKFLELIQDADIISGWNSEFFDVPYVVERIKLVMPALLHRLCFSGTRQPRERMVEKFGSQEKVYTLYGRTHLDYKDLFQKFTFEGRESYALGNILQQEIGLSKIQYEGTLEQLYTGAYSDIQLTVKNWHQAEEIDDTLASAKQKLALVRREIKRRKS